jgi:glutamate racemase
MRIGVFDSGFGGLTVLRALLDTVPQADYLYLGDSARLPYGSKSARTVAHYASSSARFLVGQGAELLVIACNSASAVALDDIRAAVAVPVIGVIEPGAASASAMSNTRRACVIGTAATVNSHAYRAALERFGMQVVEKACPLLVPLVEEGWTDHAVTEEVARIYLSELFADCERTWSGKASADVLVLGCTHYPLLTTLLKRVLPTSVTMVDSAHAVATQVAGMLPSRSADISPQRKFYATDSLDKFQTLGARFLGHRISDVQLVTLPE